MTMRNMKTTKNNRDYYCSYKFKFLKVDAETFTTYNCHAASPHAIDFTWLKNNPGQLFNTEINVSERTMMLRNERNKSCEQNCWPAEDVGAVSPRIFQKGFEKTHLKVETKPEIIDITLNSDCNLTCSYCCREFSNSWRRDLLKNGSYNVSDIERYQLTPSDKLKIKLGQTGLKQSNKYKTLLEEIKLNTYNLHKFVVTGGEPLLDNSLYQTLKYLDLPDSAKKIVYSGLGLSYKRFVTLVEKLKSIPNLIIRISAENTDKHLEFNRYGLNYNDFEKKVDYLIKENIQFEFHSTITNLSIFDFVNFYNKHAQNANCILTFGYSPCFLSPYVLDKNSKELICQQISILPISLQNQIKKSIMNNPTEQDRIDCKEFLTEFSRRRNLDLGIFPTTFLNWLEINHVV